jgi:hypothetical protein
LTRFWNRGKVERLVFSESRKNLVTYAKGEVAGSNPVV